MQLSGTTCKACSTRIDFQDEGIWCGRCKTVFHKNCRPVGQCSGCNRNFMDPSQLFVRSHLCPVCMMPNQNQDVCVVCRASTRWDTNEEYQQRKKEIHGGAKRWLFFGMIELGAGILFTALAVFAVGWLIHLFGEYLLIAAGCFIDGLRRIFIGLKYLKFE